MGDPRVVPKWLKSLPLAPEYRPTDTEFADPIAFISRIEQEASAFGICKIIPPLPKPSKRFVLANLTRSLSNSPDGASPASASKDAAATPVFTTRQQELGSRKPRGPPSVHKQVWQSGEFYTLEQFEAKSKAFAKSHLGSSFKDATPLDVETLFWKAVAEKPIYIDYANDVPGSGFASPEDTDGYHYRRRRGKKARFRHGRRSLDGSAVHLRASDAAQNNAPPKPENPEFKKDMEGTAGWKLSNSPWNLQVIARSPGSITRFMPDEVPGVTSPMVYIAMLFSWFAWHVEDHELHSLNFLHTGAPKTWYAVPGDYATTLEQVVHQHGYGDNLDKLAAFIVLGEKRTLFSPEILVASGIPCCRLVQNPGEFVVTFPRAYHVGFSHGFNCGEAANFATSKWLDFAKEAATRRAAMNYLPMLSHQQLLYMLAMSFISRVPRAFLPGARSSRLKDRRKEERELLVKKAFLQDLTHEQKLLKLLLQKKQRSYAVLWDSDLLPPGINGQASSQQASPTFIEPVPSDNKDRAAVLNKEGGTEALHSDIYDTRLYSEDCAGSGYIDDGDLPCGLDADSGVLACVACGILGYPFMCLIQPSDKGPQELFASGNKAKHKFLRVKETDSKKPDVLGDKAVLEACSDVLGKKKSMGYASFIQGEKVAKQEIANFSEVTSASVGSLAYHDTQALLENCTYENEPVNCSDHEEDEHQQKIEMDESGRCNSIEKLPSDGLKNIVRSVKNLNITVGKHFNGPLNRKKEINDEGVLSLQQNGGNPSENWNTFNPYLRPRLFCLKHALEVEELLLCRGGSHILIICNSDYLKIIGQAMSVDEEIGMQLNTEDIPLINASKEELDLINLSIDDDECKEQEDDWTVNLGVNLRQFVKGRKQPSQKQEPFALALGELVSDTCYRIAPSIRWKGKRSRTPFRMTGGNQSKQVFRIEHHIKKDNWTTTTIYNPVEEYHMSKECEDQPSSKYQKHPLNHNVEMYEKSGSLPSDTTVDIQKQGASSCIPCRNTEFVDNECLDDAQRRCYSSPENNSYSEVSKSAIPEILPLPPSSIGDSYLPAKEVRGKDSKDVDCVQLQNPSNTVVENFVLHPELPCVDSNSEDNGDEPDAPNDLGAAAAYTEEPHCDSSPVDKDGLATGVADSVLVTECPNPAIFGNPKSVQPIVVHDHLGNTACYDDEIREPSIRVAVSNGTSNAVDLDESELATETRHSVHVGLECSDPTITNKNKFTQPISVNKPNENELRVDDIMEPSQGVVFCDRVSHAVDLEATTLKEKSLGRRTEVSLNSECPADDSFSLRGSSEQYEAIEVRKTAVAANPHHVKAPRKFYVYVRRKKLTEQRDNLIMHSCTEKPVGTLINSFQSQETPARNLALTSRCIAVCSPISSDEGHCGSSDEISTVKKTSEFKRKREANQLSKTPYSNSSFIRSPCEGLRARTSRITYEEPKLRDLKITAGLIMKKPKAAVAVKQKNKAKMPVVCGLEGCKLRFQTKEELNLHRRNRCTYDGCGKRFRNHRYTMRHQRVHDNNRPFKCSWKGCSKSFNWEWARTEHLRLHTGERPYKCSDPECGLTFRFISDFSRHRRKTGHGADG